MTKSDYFIFALSVIASAFVMMALATVALASGSHHDNTQETTVINNYVTEVTEITEISQLHEYNSYTDECNGVAIASALGNNHMSLATNKLQVSFGVGNCRDEFAGSIMFGVKAGKNALINGSYARDEDIDSFGVGFTWILK